VDYSQIITTTAQRVAPFVVDAVHGSSVLAARVLAQPKKWSMGQYEQNPIQVAESTTGGDFTGLGAFDTGDVSTDINLQWLTKGYYQNITLPTALISLNNSEAGIINLVKRKMDVAKTAIMSGVGTRLYGLGTGDAIEGLQLSTDNGTYSTSYGGQSRTTYGSFVNGQVTPASSGVISFQSLAAQVDLCSAASQSSDSTNLILTTKTVWGLVETIVEAKSRGNYDTSRGYMRVSPYTPMGAAARPSELPVGMVGFDSYYFRGIPVVKDDKCPTGLVYTLNENYLKFVSLDLVGLKTINMAPQVYRGVYSGNGENGTFDQTPEQATAFQITDERMPTNQLGTVQQVVLYGNFANYNPKRSGVITGVTTV
jgi:hypothetical protein